MKKSLLITNFFPPKIGGIENYFKNLCYQLPEDKISILTDDDLPRGDFDKKYKRKIIRLNFYPWRFFKPSWLPLFWRIKKIIKQEKIQYLQFGHYFNLVTVGLVFKKLFKIPYLVYTHGVDTLIPQKNWLQKKIMTKNLKNAQWVIANTEFMKQKIIELGVFPSKIIVVYPSLNQNIFKVKTSSNFIKKKYNLNNKKVLLTLGRLVKRKGQDMVIRSLPKILKKIPNLIYLIVGDGPDKEYLQNLTEKLGLKNKVIFTGAVKDNLLKKIPFYQAADLFIMPTREEKEKKDLESFGLAYLEAQSQRIPVILGLAGGTKETIIDRQTGLAVNSKSVNEISQAVIKLLNNYEYSKLLGEKGFNWVKKTFNWQTQIKKVKFILKNNNELSKKYEKPLISVIIPAFGASDFIDSCLNSIQLQSLKNYEIIVINDGPDKKLNQVLRQYKNLLVLKRKHKGELPDQAAAVRNLGASKARGKYLFFCDSDIILKPNCLLEMFKVLELNPFVSFCYSGFIFGSKKFHPLKFSKNRLKKYNYISTMSLMKKKDFPGFDEKLARFQDWDLWLTMIKEGKKGLALNKILFKGPMRKQGISKTINKEKYQKMVTKKHKLN
ncbi:MAG: glycosyltransferase [Patescibacteria group bacterium]|nr:glycosyltransferase [Patescibacteria group bacterium]